MTNYVLANNEKKVREKLDFVPFNDILNIMKIHSDGKNNAVCKMVKKLDPIMINSNCKL